VGRVWGGVGWCVCVCVWVVGWRVGWGWGGVGWVGWVGRWRRCEGDGRRGGFLGSLLEDFLKLDMRKWLQLLHNLNLLPRVLGQDWTVVFLQRFGGTVTMVPHLRVQDYLCVISDPTRDRMAAYLLGGQRVTWPKLAMVANRVRIEQALRRAASSTASEPEGPHGGGEDTGGAAAL
jgi:hypothetical protein